MRLVGILFLLGLLVWGVGDRAAQRLADDRLNGYVPANLAVSAEAEALHRSLVVVDLHSDMLLWDRDPRRRQARGHTDLPRLADGNVELQVFSTVTASPKGQNFDVNTLEGGDNITTLAAAQGWPLATVGSIRARAVHQAERLTALEREGRLTIVRRAGDLEADGLKGLLLTEGAHPLEGELGNVGHLFDAGYRAMGLHHFFDNELGGSMHGTSGAGLTDFGREAVREMDRLGVLVDLAHSSEAVVDDVLAMRVSGELSRPVFVSHTGLRSACPATANRNMSDGRLRAIAADGGLVGIGFFAGAICDTSPAGIANTIVAAVKVLGEDAVALGSDFDGAVTTTVAADDLAQITQALLDAGMGERVIRKVMGGNAMRYFGANLPG